MSGFKDAFDEARKSKQTEFGYQGKQFNTRMKGESDADYKSFLGPSTPEAGGLSKNLRLAQAGMQLAGVAQGGQQGGGSPSAVGGALSGAMAGAQFGPMGAAVGGVVGGVAGAIGARSARKQAQREAFAKAEEEKAQAVQAIEGQKGQRISEALSGLSSAFSRNFGSTRQVRL